MCRLFAFLENTFFRRGTDDKVTVDDLKKKPEETWEDEDEHTEVVWRGFVRAFATADA